MNQMENVALGDCTLSKLIRNLCLISKENVLAQAGYSSSQAAFYHSKKSLMKETRCSDNSPPSSGALSNYVLFSLLPVCLFDFLNDCLGQSLGSELKGGIFNQLLTNVIRNREEGGHLRVQLSS